ncbi:MAG: flagellar basal body rod protein FlgC [Lachnospiraceae bacterium]|nr:flagellar basal body rod protein FlgC [Lachnospiraceae bacterium]
MGMFDALDISASGLTAQRYRMDIISENVANANTTRKEDGSIYRRKVVTFEAKGDNNVPFKTVLGRSTADLSNHLGDGVRITSISEDRITPEKKVYDPSHPDADEAGYVYYPNVDIITEMTNLIDASRAYEANATVVDATKNMIQQGLQIGKG